MQACGKLICLSDHPVAFSLATMRLFLHSYSRMEAPQSPQESTRVSLLMNWPLYAKVVSHPESDYSCTIEKMWGVISLWQLRNSLGDASGMTMVETPNISHWLI